MCEKTIRNNLYFISLKQIEYYEPMRYSMIWKVTLQTILLVWFCRCFLLSINGQKFQGWSIVKPCSWRTNAAASDGNKNIRNVAIGCLSQFNMNWSLKIWYCRILLHENAPYICRYEKKINGMHQMSSYSKQRA